MIRRRGILRHDRRGSAALELALLAPVMVSLFCGTIEVTQLIRVETKLGLAAQSLQNMVAGQSSVTQTTVDNFFVGSQLVMTPFAGSKLTATVASVTFSSAGASSALAWQLLEPGTASAASMSTITACGLAKGLSLGSDSVIIVRMTYSYTPVLSYLLASSYSLTQVAYGRPRNVTTVSGASTSGAATGSC